MFRLARVETVAPEPAASNLLDVPAGTPPATALAPSDLHAQGDAPTTPAEFALTNDGARLRLAGDAPAPLYVSPPLRVRPRTDYLLRLPLKLEEGSVLIEVVDERDARLAATPILHPIKYLDFTPGRQPAVETDRPFVNDDAQAVRVVVRNGGRRPARVVAEVGALELYALGPARYLWTRYPRALVHALQSLFLTATVLPFVVVGIALVVRRGRWRVAAVLLAVPVYYACTQSLLWTEFRYILAMHYFLFILAAVGLHGAGRLLWAGVARLRAR